MSAFFGLFPRNTIESPYARPSCLDDGRDTDLVVMLAILCLYLLPLALLLLMTASAKVTVPGHTGAVVSSSLHSDPHRSLSPSHVPPTFVFVEGIIGAGKTTFIDKLLAASRKRTNSFELIEWKEPVHEWTGTCAESDKSLFKAYYEDKKRYAFHFQSFVFATRVGQYIKLLTQDRERVCGNVVIVERSIHTCGIFGRVLFEGGCMDDLGHRIVTSAVKMVPEPENSITVYLRTSVDVAKNRIELRGREGEDSIDAAYLEQLHRAHEEAFGTTADLILNGDHNEDCVENWCEQVLDYIHGRHTGLGTRHCSN